MSANGRSRFLVRDCEGTAIARYSQKRHAVVRATQEARMRGYEIEVFDSMAEVSKVCLWVVLPSGKVQAAGVRSVESEKRDLQAGSARS